MCLVHDIGEAFTGDIPSFSKTKSDEEAESDAVGRFISSLPEPYRAELTELFSEMESLSTREARIYKALDKMEAIIQHNEADVSTWLPLEYDLNLTYGVPESHAEPYLERLRSALAEVTKSKAPEYYGKKQP